MSGKNPTHIVVQDGLYFGTGKDGRPEEMAVDTQLSLTKKQAEKLEKRGMVKSIKDVEALDVSDAEGEAEVKSLKDEIKTLTDAAETSAEEIKTLTDEVEALKAAADEGGEGGEGKVDKSQTPPPPVNQVKQN